MITETTVGTKKRIYGGKRYHLCYRVIAEDNCHFIEVICRMNEVVEREKVAVDATFSQVYHIAKLFLQETVFPIALKETLENYL